MSLESLEPTGEVPLEQLEAIIESQAKLARIKHLAMLLNADYRGVLERHIENIQVSLDHQSPRKGGHTKNTRSH